MNNEIPKETSLPAWRFYYMALAGIIGATFATAFYCTFCIVVLPRCPKPWDDYLLMGIIIAAGALYASFFPFAGRLLAKTGLKPAFRAMAIGGALGGGTVVAVPLLLSFFFDWMSWRPGNVEYILIAWVPVSAFIGGITGVIEKDFLKIAAGFASSLVGGVFASLICYFLWRELHSNEMAFFFALLAFSGIPTGIAVTAYNKKPAGALEYIKENEVYK